MNKKIEVQELGIGLTVPEGWHFVKLSAGYIFGNPNVQGLIMLIFHYSDSLEEMKNEIYAGFYDSTGGFSIQVDGKAKVLDDRTILVNYKGTAHNEPAKGYGISLLSPFGGGVLIIAITNPDVFNESYMDYVDEIAENVEFFEPESTDFVKEWMKFLQGKTIKGKEGVPLYFEEEGVFRVVTDDDEKGVSKTGYFEGRMPKTSGQWEILEVMEQAILKLTYFDGTERQYTLVYDNEELFLNNQKWLMI